MRTGFAGSGQHDKHDANGTVVEHGIPEGLTAGERATVMQTDAGCKAMRLYYAALARAEAAEQDHERKHVMWHEERRVTTALQSALAEMTARAEVAERDREEWMRSSTARGMALKSAESRLADLEESRRRAVAEMGVMQRKATEATALVGRVAEHIGYLEQDIAAARKNREPQTGMHVPYHGAFCSAHISTIKDLERFARTMRAVVSATPAPAATAEPENPEADERHAKLVSVADKLRASRILVERIEFELRNGFCGDCQRALALIRAAKEGT